MTSAVALAGGIGVSVPKADDVFLSTLVDSIRKQAAAKNVAVDVRFAEGSADRQIQTMKDFAAAKVDALIVVPVDGDRGKEISKIASDASIPLVYANSMPANIDDLPEKQAFVASNEIESGTLQTREVCRKLEGRGAIVVMMGELIHPAARSRTDDISAVLAQDDCKGIEIVERQSANWSRTQAASLMREWLGAGVRFDGVIANNDEMALGAISAMKAEGLSMRKVVVAGIDGTADALAAMKAGDLSVTVHQSAAGQGSGAVDAALALMSGATLPTRNYVPFELVTPENMARFAVKN